MEAQAPRELASLWARRAARRHLQESPKNPLKEGPLNRLVVATDTYQPKYYLNRVSMPFKQTGAYKRQEPSAKSQAVQGAESEITLDSGAAKFVRHGVA